MITQSLYLEVLEKEYNLRAHRNTNYSLRAFARDLGLSAALLSQVMRKRRGLSSKMAQSICSKLKLSSTEAELFVCSVEAAFSRSQNSRLQANLRLNDLKSKSKGLRKYRIDEMTTANRWHHFAILEILERHDFKPDAAWISRQLGINLQIVKRSLQELKNLGWIEQEGQNWVATHVQSETSFDIPSSEIKSLHLQFMDLAKKAIFEEKIEDREFLNMTLAFRSEKIREAKTAIRDFQKRFAEQFYDSSSEKDSVYQISTQFFRLDNKG